MRWALRLIRSQPAPAEGKAAGRLPERPTYARHLCSRQPAGKCCCQAMSGILYLSHRADPGRTPCLLLSAAMRCCVAAHGTRGWLCTSRRTGDGDQCSHAPQSRLLASKHESRAGLHRQRTQPARLDLHQGGERQPGAQAAVGCWRTWWADCGLQGPCTMATQGSGSDLSCCACQLNRPQCWRWPCCESLSGLGAVLIITGPANFRLCAEQSGLVLRASRTTTNPQQPRFSLHQCGWGSCLSGPKRVHHVHPGLVSELQA